MDWEAALQLAATVSGLTVGVVVLWAYGHLRLKFQQQAEKQLQHIKRLLEMIDKQQDQLAKLNAHVNTLTDQSGKLTRVVTGIVERNGGGGDDDTPRLLH